MDNKQGLNEENEAIHRILENIINKYSPDAPGPDIQLPPEPVGRVNTQPHTPDPGETQVLEHLPPGPGPTPIPHKVPEVQPTSTEDDLSKTVILSAKDLRKPITPEDDDLDKTVIASHMSTPKPSFKEEELKKTVILSSLKSKTPDHSETSDANETVIIQHSNLRGKPKR